jgi:hypothetical protein
VTFVFVRECEREDWRDGVDVDDLDAETSSIRIISELPLKSTDSLAFCPARSEGIVKSRTLAFKIEIFRVLTEQEMWHLHC